MICFSDQKEKYVKPGKGAKHAYQVLANLFNLKPTSLQTDLAKAIDFSLNIIKRKSVVVLISDFIDEGYEHNLKALSKKHDLVVIHVNDKRETELPSLGIVPLLEKESKKTIWVNTASLDFRKNIAARYSGNQTKLETFCLKQQANYLSIRTDQDDVPKLIKLFKVRNKRMKSA